MKWKCCTCHLFVLSVKSTTYLTLPVVEQEPYVIPEERRKTQGEKYRYKEDEKYLVPEKATVYQNPECTQTDLIQVVRKFVLTFVLPAPPQWLMVALWNVSKYTLSICLLEWASNNVFLPVKPDAEEEPEGGGRDPQAVQDCVSQEEQKKLQNGFLILMSISTLSHQLYNYESRRNCWPTGSGGPFWGYISHRQNSDATWQVIIYIV